MSEFTFADVELKLGREIAALNSSQQEHAIEIAHMHWRQRGFPFTSPNKKLALRELELLQKITAGDLSTVLEKPSSLGLRTANSLQPSMWSVKVKGRTPLECFEHDDTLISILKKCVRLRPDRRCWSPTEIRTFCGLHNRSRASNFRPAVAKAIYEKYSPPKSKVLDFSAGFGGRAFGAFAADREYHGIDPERKQVSGIRKLSKLVNGTCELSVSCAEEKLFEFEDNAYDLVFTSPPYFNLEKYSNNSHQSWKKYPTMDSWLAGFLRPVVLQSHRVLKDHGYFVVNIANLPKYEIADRFVEHAKQIFGPLKKVHNLNLRSNPSYASKYGDRRRVEPIFVFRKNSHVR